MTAQEDKLNEKLDSILDKITEVREWQIKLTSQQESASKERTDLANAIWGNGKPGLRDRVVELGHESREQKELCAMMRGLHMPIPRWKNAAWGVAEKVISYAILAVITAFFLLYVEHAAPKILTQSLQGTSAHNTRDGR